MQKAQEVNTGFIDTLKTIALVLLAIAAGLVISLFLLPTTIPALVESLSGADPKVYWYLSRASAIAAFWVLWLSMAFGLILTGKAARVWPGAAQAMELHEYTSLLGLGIAMFHALILLGDHYIQFTPIQILLPFSTQGYKPFWVGLGQVSFYLWAIITISFYLRKRIGTKAWRFIHYATFLTYAMALLHGITSGSDSQALWATIMYWVSGGLLLFLVIYRLLLTNYARQMEKASS